MSASWKAFKDWLWPSVTQRNFVSKGFAQALEELEPGKVYQFSSLNGDQYCVMHRDDLDHVMSLARLKLTDVA